MNQKNLISLIILDIIVIALAFGLILFRLNALHESPAAPPVSKAEASFAEETEVSPGEETLTQLPATRTRNIGFTYRNSQVSKVEIIGDFNDWIPKPMLKGSDHKWSITLSIPPGEYAYNYIVNGKPIRDPNNPKVCNIGRGFPNSFLKVNTF